MNFIKQHAFPIFGALLFIVLVVGGSWYYLAKVYVPAFPIAAEDGQISWAFKGAYSGNDALMAKGQADIDASEKLLGTGAYDDSTLYLGIGNDYVLMGEGQNAYDAYNKAIHIHPDKGLAYMNLGNLMSTLGAYGTARDAYAKAVAVEPGLLEFHLERLTFLTTHFRDNQALVAAAFGDASKQFGDAAAILVIEAPWLEATGRIADAIKAWETAKMLSSRDRAPAIDAEIARLKAKL